LPFVHLLGEIKLDDAGLYFRHYLDRQVLE
jgi:hypothetical protein